ncbi:hypothetical protein ACUNWD_04090 [Sunxiuqinia sp. A32]|uniref:hypothetical protein n=1 Tax=Sunxiuqinia sp. A32 TaxID=3461496 RepID=UPI004045DA69
MYSAEVSRESREINIAVVGGGTVIYIHKSRLNQINRLVSAFENICRIFNHGLSINSMLFLNGFIDYSSKLKFGLQITLDSHSIENSQVLFQQNGMQASSLFCESMDYEIDIKKPIIR